MNGLENESLEPRREKAVFLLFEGRTINEVAEEVGVDRSTIHRWKTGDPRFIAELNRLKQSYSEARERKLQEAWMGAIEAAQKMLEHEDPKIQMRAIELILRQKVRDRSGPVSVKGAQDAVLLSKLL